MRMKLLVKTVVTVLLAMAPLAAYAEDVDYGDDPNMPPIRPYESESRVDCGSWGGAGGALDSCSKKGLPVNEVREAVEVAQTIEPAPSPESLKEIDKAMANIVRLPAGFLSNRCPVGSR